MKLKYFVLTLFTIMIFSSCAKNENIQDDTLDNEIKADEENNLVYNTPDSGKISILIKRTNTLNPLLTTDETLKETLGLVYQNIISFTEDDKVSLNLIDSYTFDENTNVFTIKVTDGIFWHDKIKQVTATDFVYSYEVLKNAPENAVYKNVIKDIIYFRKIDEKTVEVKVNNPYIGAPYFLAFPVIPEHRKSVTDLKDSVHLNTVVGNGVYKNTNISVNNTIYLEDNDGDDINPSIKNIEIIVTESDESAYYGFEQGIGNVLISKVESWSKYHTNRSVNINQYNKMEMIVLGFNFKNSVVNDVNFRKSVYYAIPFEQIINSIYLGFCNTSRTLYPTNHFAYNENIIGEEFDGEKAQTFLSSSNYNNEQIKMVVQSGSKELNKTAELIRENLATIGVNIEIITMPYEEYMEAITDGNYDIYLGDYVMDILPKFDKLVGNKNYSNYNNEGLISLIQTLNNAKSYEEYINIANQLQNIIYSEKPIIPIIHANDAIITDKNIVTTKPRSYDSPYQNIDQWYITEYTNEW